jgi:hypothetical protein
MLTIMSVSPIPTYFCACIARAGGHAYHGIPKALLGHQVAVCGLRPAFPDFAPSEYRALAEACWQADPDKRYGE